MANEVLTYHDASVETKSREGTATSQAPFELSRLSWPLSCRRDATLWVQNVTGLILKWREQKLDLDLDAQHRSNFFGFANLLKAFTDEIQKEITPKTDEPGWRFISTSLPTWEKRFEELRQLRDNWDSYGGRRISDAAIEKGRAILAAMTAAGCSEQFFVAPTHNGGIEIEWELPSKELVLEIPPNGQPLTYLLVEKTITGEEHEAEKTIPEAEDLKQLLQEIGA